MAFLDHIRFCNAHDLKEFVPFRVGQARVGLMRRSLSLELRRFGGLFHVFEDLVHLDPRLSTYEDRTKAVDDALDGGGVHRRQPAQAVLGHGAQFMQLGQCRELRRRQPARHPLGEDCRVPLLRLPEQEADLRIQAVGFVDQTHSAASDRDVSSSSISRMMRR